METVWRLCGDSVEIDIFYGDFMVKLVWRMSPLKILLGIDTNPLGKLLAYKDNLQFYHEHRKYLS